MDSHQRKRSFDQIISDKEDQDQSTESGLHLEENDNGANMTKSSRKKHRASKARKHQQPEPNGAGVSNKPGLHFASHRLNSSVRLADLRDLVLYCLADGIAPTWISVQNKNQFQKAVVLLVPGLERSMFDGILPLEPKVDASESQSENANTEIADGGWTVVNRSANRTESDPDNYLPMPLVEEHLPTPLKPLGAVFQDLWPVKAPGDNKYSKVHSPLHSMLQRIVQETPDEKFKRKNSKGAKPVRVRDDFATKRTPITEFVATVEELRDNGYVVHPALLHNEAEKERELERREKQSTSSSSGWRDVDVTAHSESTEKTDADSTNANIIDGRTIYAIDCEMCLVGEDEPALTRISMLSWDGQTIMDELVKPDRPITNYLTQYSGVSEEMLKDVTTTLTDIQDRLLKLLTVDTILVGHSLDSDLKALKLTHPYIVDTSIIYPHPRGPPMKSSLKWLCQKYLSREIQKGHGSKGHNSVEDAQACLDLVRLKCEKGKQWGTPDAVNESIFKVLSKKPKSGQHSGISEGRQGAIVDLGSPERNFGQQAAYSIGCKDDDGVVDAVKRCVLGDHDGEYIPGGGVELTWARLRELDYLRGWANNNRHDDPLAVQQDLSTEELAAAVLRTTSRIAAIRDYLPPCTLLIVYSGTGDPKELGRLQDMERQYKKEYAIKKWDELSVKWTDTEAQALRRACEVARSGIGFMCVT